jgi:hypothetical protein
MGDVRGRGMARHNVRPYVEPSDEAEVFLEGVIDLRGWLGGRYGAGGFDSSLGYRVPGLAAAFQLSQRSGGE